MLKAVLRICGNSDPAPTPDPSPDPANFDNELQDENWKYKVFIIITFWSYISSFLKDKKS